MKKLRLVNSEELGKTYEAASQLKSHLEDLYVRLDANSLNDLPSSMIPSELLYNLVASYYYLYNFSLNNELIKLGSSKQSNNYH